jgi:hypothetical protein
MRPLIVGLLITVVIVGLAEPISSFAPQRDGVLVPAIERGKWGYIDLQGYWRIRPRFEQGVLFSDGFAAVRSMTGWGFIDLNGRERTPARFSAVGNFNSGRAPVRVARRWGFIDTAGKMIVEPMFQTASDFHDGLARIEFWDNVCGMSNDVAPEEYFDRKYTTLSVIPSAGCGAVHSRIGYVNREGVLVIPAQYADGSDFSEGTAVVVRSDWAARAYIDTKGQVILGLYALAEPFSDGLASVVLREDNDKRNERAIVIDHSGNQAFERRFPVTLRAFVGGLAPALSVSPIGWIYIDRTGKTVFNTVFTQAFPFSDGLAVVWLRSQGNQAYIDTTGRIVFRAPVGAEARPVRNGIIEVRLKDGSSQYFDRAGAPILPRSSQ